MTHPLTPREKVRKAIIDVMKPKHADITLGRVDTCTDAILTALASGSGDHAELAGLICWLGDAADAECDRDQKSGLRKAAACLEAVRIERDTAQSAVEAWAYVCESLEAHLQDRVAMQDVAAPERYLRILRSNIARVQKDSEQIRAARWADYRRHEARATEAERALSEYRIAADLLVSSLKADKAEAERKLAEAVGLLETVSLMFHPDSAHGRHVRTFLSKEAERG